MTKKIRISFGNCFEFSIMSYLSIGLALIIYSYYHAIDNKGTDS